MNWKQRAYASGLIFLFGCYLGYTIHPFIFGVTGFLIGKIGGYPLIKWIYYKLGD